MAKNTIEIDVKVDDNGTTQKTALKAKNLADQLNKTGKSAGTLDRNLKGTAQASANSTKNFAKMSQGMGGLVGLYAGFAAQVFALSAAFNFLKNAADLENLKKSQISFAQSSGLALKSTTTALQEASQGMLGFKEASQAAAIGVAKGFSTSQLTELTIGASKASTALGRSYEDTFDRLLRGVSKAEPELLDELGITLRLETATQRYADAIGKSRDELTAAERSQAVFVETMRQLNDSFGAVDPQANPFVQLSKTFEELIQDLTGKFMPTITKVVDLINKNAKVALAAFTALAGYIILSLPGISGAVSKTTKLMSSNFVSAGVTIGGVFSGLSSKIGEGIKNAAAEAVYNIEFAELELEEKLAQLGKSGKGAKSLVSEGVKSKTVQKIAAGEDVDPRQLGRLSKDLERVRKELEETGEVAKGVFKGATLESVKKLEEELSQIGNVSLSSGQKMQKYIGKVGVVALKGASRAAEYTGKAVRGIGVAALWTGKAVKKIGKAFRVFAIVGTAVLGVIKIMDELARTPVTVIDNFKSFLTGLIKMVQNALNLLTAGLNKLLDNSVVRKIFGVEEGTAIIGEFTFADNIEENLNSLETRVLNRLGTTRENLQKVEDKNREADEAEAKRIEILDRMTSKYTELREEIDKITSGIRAQKDEMKKTSQITTGIASLPIGAAIREAQKSEDVQAAFDKIFEGVDISAFGKTFEDAFNQALTGDFKALEKATTAATTYNSSLASIKDASQTLRNDLGSGDPLKARVLADQLILVAENGDKAAKVLGENGGLKELLDSYAGTDLNVLRDSLKDLEARFDSIQSKKSQLSIQQAGSRMSGALASQQGLRDNAELAGLNLEEKQLQLEQYKLSRRNLNAEEQVLHDREVERQEREIALLKEKFRIAQENTNNLAQIGVAVGDSLTSSLQSAFDGLIQGTMTAKEAFANMAKSMLQSIAKVIAELLTAKLLMAAFGGTSFGNFLGIGGGATAATGAASLTQTSGFTPGVSLTGGGFRYGGISEPPQMASGGIVSGAQRGYPAVLHGTEAVVPLPNNRSIPVDLNGAGQQNNVTVNVAVDSNGNAQQNTQANGQQGANLGNAIAAAVQKELQNQKRSGGILNPYGVA